MSSIILPPSHTGSSLRLAFSGKMRSGKEEAMKYLNEKYFNNSAFVINFADPLYTLCKTIQTYCGFPVEKDRGLLQYIGTDYGRAKNPNVWINKLFGDIECYHFDKTVMIGDARFTNEMDACKERNIPVIKIQASDEVRLSRGADYDKLNHASELDMDTYERYDFIIENNGTLEEFHTKLDIMFGDVLTLMTKTASTYRSSGSPLKIELIDDVLVQNGIESGVRITTSGLYLPN
jgi:hypothetical protein